MEVKGFTVANGHLDYVVGLHIVTKQLTIIKMCAEYIDNIRSPNNSYWYYSIEYSTTVRHESSPSEVYVKSGAFIDSNNCTGYRIYIYGRIQSTAIQDKSYLYIFNTAYNITESAYESNTTYDEGGVAVHANKDLVILISEVHTNEFENSTSYEKGNYPGEPTLNIGIRAFSTNGFLLQWARVVGSEYYDDSYAGSDLLGYTLYIAVNTHSLNAVSMYAIFTTSGIPSSFSYSSNQLTAQNGVTAYQLKATYKGIFLLIHKSDQLTYSKKLGIYYSLLNTDSTLPDVAIIAFDRQLNILSISPIKTEGVISYYPKIFITFETSDFYKFILLAHTSKSVGLIFYTLTETNTSYAGVLEIANCSNIGRCYSPISYISCFSVYFQDFQCISSCASGYYLVDRTCIPCHYSCAQCAGPSKDECIACASARELANLAQVGECVCSSGVEYAESCLPKCSISAPNLYNGVCMPNCPSYSIPDFTNIVTTSPYPYSPSVTGYYLLTFSSSAKGIKLPGPPNYSINNLPNDYSISFWAMLKESREAILLNAFGVIVFSAHLNNSVDVIIQSTPSITLTSAASIVEPNKWIYYHLDIQNTGTANFYILKHGAASSILINSKPYSPPLSLVNAFVLGSSVNANSDPVASLSFNGYICELKYIEKSMGAAHILDESSRAYYSYSQNNPYLKAYWHLDYIYVKGTSTYIKDSSMFQLNTTIGYLTSAYPQMIASTVGSNAVGMAYTADVAECLDILASKNRIPIVMAIHQIIPNRLQFRLNEQPAGISTLIQAMLNSNYLELKDVNCAGTTVASIRVGVNSNVFQLQDIDIVNALSPNIGKYISVCLKHKGQYFQLDRFYVRIHINSFAFFNDRPGI